APLRIIAAALTSTSVAVAVAAAVEPENAPRDLRHREGLHLLGPLRVDCLEAEWRRVQRQVRDQHGIPAEDEAGGEQEPARLSPLDATEVAQLRDRLARERDLVRERVPRL